MRQYREQNREKLRKYNREYAKNHREYFQAYYRNNRKRLNKQSRELIQDYQYYTADALYHRMPWSPEEDAVVLAHEDTYANIALMLGRTYDGVAQRAHKLRKRGHDDCSRID